MREDTNMAKTWVVVADSARARIFALAKRGEALEEVDELLHPASRAHERELATDCPGRAFDSEGPGRRAMSESISPRQHEAWKLRRELADAIETARAQDRFDRLVLVAGPSFLGELRKTLSDQTARLVVGELDKNLAQMDAQDILQHLPAGVLG
jgi:protein required for attachment to host cells